MVSRPPQTCAKYNVFWKGLNFKEFLGSQLEAPQMLRDARKKDSVFYIFAIYQSRAPKKMTVWNESSSVLDRRKWQKWSRCWIRKCGSSQLKKNELQLNGVLKRRKRGSSQLGGVSNTWNSVFCCFETWELSTRMAKKMSIWRRLHGKVNEKLIANQRKPLFWRVVSNFHSQGLCLV